MNDKDKILVDDSISITADAVIDAIAKSLPGINIAWNLSKALYGAGMKLRQERALEWVEMVRDNPSIFKKQIFTDEELQDGFVTALEGFLKQRSDLKRKILKKIFLGYAKDSDKKTFELERLDDILLRISLTTLEFLSFVKAESLKALDEEIVDEINQDYYQKSDMSLEWWINQLRITKSIWLPIEKWLAENYGPGTKKVKEMYGIKNDEGWIPDLQHRAETREKRKRTEISECMNELVTLGIFRSKTATYNGGTDYSFTEFGIKFLEFISS